MTEEWKDIPDYEGMYQISNLGNIKSLERYRKDKRCEYRLKETIIKPHQNGKYLRVELSKNGKVKLYYIHRLMAYTFLGLERNSKLQVDHIDNNCLNNNIENLQILTQKENLKKQMKNMQNNYSKYKNNPIINMIKGSNSR